VRALSLCQSHTLDEMSRVAVVGATGAVGKEILRCLDVRKFPLKELRLLASSRSAGSTVSFQGKDHTVGLLDEDAFEDIDVAFFSAGGGLSKQFAPAVTKAGATMIDNSSAFRMTEGVPLIVPEVNPEALNEVRILPQRTHQVSECNPVDFFLWF